jgi:outer membrane protein assembly factor BamB
MCGTSQQASTALVGLLSSTVNANAVKRALYLILPAVVIAAAVALIILRPWAPAVRVSEGSWPMYQYSPDHNAVFPGSLSVKWSHKSGAEINGGFAIVGNTLYGVNFKNETFALDLQTGKRRWTATAKNIVMSTPIVTNGLVVVGSGKNEVTVDTKDQYLWSVPQGDDLLAYRIQNGSLAWRVHTLGEDMASAGLSGSTLVLANGDMHAYGIEAATGKVVWKKPIPGVDTMGSTAVVDGTSYVIASMGVPYQYGPNTHVLAMNSATGKVLWSAPYGNSDCAPTVGGGMVFVEASINHRHDPVPIGGYNEVYGIDAATGKLRWKYTAENHGFYTSVGSSERAVAATYDKGVLYQSLPVSTEFAAFQARTGKLLWKIDTEGTVKMSPVVSNGVVYFGDSSGLLYTVNANTGRIANVKVFRAPFATSPPILYGATLFIANGDTVYAIPRSEL